MKTPVEVNFKANGVEGVQRGFKAVAKEGAAVGTMARSTGNSLNLMAAAASSGIGSLTGLATAAGNVAQGMAEMSKNSRLAASAVGIGVLGAAIGVLIGLAIEAKRRLADIPNGLASNSALAHIGNLKTDQQVQDYIALIQGNRDRLASGLKRGDEKGLQQVTNYDAQIAAAYARRAELARAKGPTVKVSSGKTAKEGQQEADTRAKMLAAGMIEDAKYKYAADGIGEIDLGGVVDDVTKTLDRLNAQMQERINTASILSRTLGDVIAAGFNDGFAAAGKTMLASLGGLLRELGEQSLKGLILAQLVKRGLTSFNPAVGFAGAIGLIALGSAMQAGAGRGGSGGSSGGGSGGGATPAMDSLRFPMTAGGISSPMPNARTPMSFTVIGDGPKIQREIAQIVNGANDRGLIRG